MNDYTKPVYKIDGKEFKTVTGLCGYLGKKHRANTVTGIGSDRKLRVMSRGGIACGQVIAEYQVSAPEIGKPMTLTQIEGATK